MKGQTNEDFHVFYFRKMAKGSTVELHLWVYVCSVW